MVERSSEDWLAGPGRFDVTCACERGLRAAAGTFWQYMAFLASGTMSELGADHFAVSRQVVAAYLRRTGRIDEAMEVEAIGCNEPPPPTGFGRLTAAQRDDLRDVLGG